MAYVNLVFTMNTPQTSIGALELDALLSEEIRLTSDVTQYPVEGGGFISDHIQALPEELNLSGIITGAGTALYFGGGKSRLVEAVQALRKLHEDESPITISTGLATYEDYAIVSLSMVRSNDTEAIDIEATFRKINRVALETTQIPPERIPESSVRNKVGNTEAKGGEINDKTAEEVPTKRSLLKKALNLVQGGGGDSNPSAEP